MKAYDSYSGNNYELGEVLKDGGDGKVYEIIGNSDIAAKIYRENNFGSPDELSAMERKLKTMISMKIPARIDGILLLAWPMDILYENGSLAGFIMPRINAECPLFYVFKADPCRKGEEISYSNPFERAFPDYTWKYHVQIAYNIAWIVSFLHCNGIVVGDLYPGNIYLDIRTGNVILSGCDSFDIRDPRTGEHFPCAAGLPELLAPELQTVGRLSNGTFTEETDNFSLAILIFRLLMRSADPFGGVITLRESGSITQYSKAILNGECVYVKDVPGKKIPWWAPTLDMLPSEIQDLFRKTFDYDAATAAERIRNRATASEWCKALLPLAASEPNDHLKRCVASARHIYPAGSFYCPWCRIRQHEGRTSPKPEPASDTRTGPGSVSAISGKTRHLFCLAVIALGLAGGFVFRNRLSGLIHSLFGTDISDGNR